MIEKSEYVMAKKRIERKKPSRGSFVGQKGLADRVAEVEASVARIEHPEFAAGDTLKVHAKIKEGDKERIQIFEGVIIARANRGGSKSFTIRKISHGVGVERIFLENSPRIAKIEVVQRGSVRRAKLYYLRELQGRAARVEREVETQAASAARKAAKATKGSDQSN